MMQERKKAETVGHMQEERTYGRRHADFVHD